MDFRPYYDPSSSPRPPINNSGTYRPSPTTFPSHSTHVQTLRDPSPPPLRSRFSSPPCSYSPATPYSLSSPLEVRSSIPCCITTRITLSELQDSIDYFLASEAANIIRSSTMTSIPNPPPHNIPNSFNSRSIKPQSPLRIAGSDMDRNSSPFAPVSRVVVNKLSLASQKQAYPASGSLPNGREGDLASHSIKGS